MSKLISNPLTAAIASTITDNANNSIQQLKPHHAPLSAQQRIGVRTMAEGREGMVRLMNTIAQQHINSLPRNEEPAEMTNLLDAFTQGGKAIQAVKELLEMLEDTQTSVGIDLMALYDRYNGHLQTARTANTSLDSAMQEIDAYNSRFGKTTSAPDTPTE